MATCNHCGMTKFYDCECNPIHQCHECQNHFWETIISRADHKARCESCHYDHMQEHYYSCIQTTDYEEN